MILTTAILTVNLTGSPSGVTFAFLACRTRHTNHPMPNDNIPPCACGYLKNAATNPFSNVQFDSRLNEYHFVGTHSRTLLYHCPFCGGRTPKSLRANLFANIPSHESERLNALVGDLHTLDAILNRLGEPDLNLKCNPSHSLVYQRLSECAEVRFDKSTAGDFQALISGKPLKASSSTPQTPSASAGGPR